jgi:predicted MFS family arabinose efflux permease
MTDRGASNLMIGAGFLMYGVPFALLATTGGRLSDRHGAYRMSMFSLLLVAPLTAVYGLLTVPAALMLLFAVEGSVQALGVPATQSLVARAAPAGRASAAQGLSGAMNLAGATISAVAAPAIYEAWGPGTLFATAGALVLMAGGAAAALRRTAAPLPVTVS